MSDLDSQAIIICDEVAIQALKNSGATRLTFYEVGYIALQSTGIDP